MTDTFSFFSPISVRHHHYDGNFILSSYNFDHHPHLNRQACNQAVIHFYRKIYDAKDKRTPENDLEEHDSDQSSHGELGADFIDKINEIYHCCNSENSHYTDKAVEAEQG